MFHSDNKSSGATYVRISYHWIFGWQVASMQLICVYKVFIYVYQTNSFRPFLFWIRSCQPVAMNPVNVLTNGLMFRYLNLFSLLFLISLFELQINILFIIFPLLRSANIRTWHMTYKSIGCQQKLPITEMNEYRGRTLTCITYKLLWNISGHFFLCFKIIWLVFQFWWFLPSSKCAPICEYYVLLTVPSIVIEKERMNKSMFIEMAQCILFLAEDYQIRDVQRRIITLLNSCVTKLIQKCTYFL